MLYLLCVLSYLIHFKYVYYVTNIYRHFGAQLGSSGNRAGRGTYKDHSGTSGAWGHMLTLLLGRKGGVMSLSMEVGRWCALLGKTAELDFVLRANKNEQRQHQKLCVLPKETSWNMNLFHIGTTPHQCYSKGSPCLVPLHELCVIWVMIE